MTTDQELDKMLEHVKKEVFIGTNAAFLGSILCSVEFHWDKQQPDTVWTDGLRIGWGPSDFLECSVAERRSTLLHELWHVALLHQARRGTRDAQLWNIACDYRINNDLRRDGYTVPDTWVVNPDIDADGILAEEEIYEKLLQNAIPRPPQSPDDLKESEGKGQSGPDTVAAVVRALQAAQMAGQAGTLPGHLKTAINQFLEPVIPWRAVLTQWMTDLSDEEEYTWRKRNRRFDNIYMPSRECEESRLEHLVYFQDTSGSITPQDLVRFNSEVKYVQEVLKPTRLTLVQFDVEIQYVREFTQDEPFEEIEIHGGGGTDLTPVHEWINEHKPTAAIVFSDLECAPMKPLKQNIPIIWAAIRNKHARVPFGKLIHITN